MGNFFGPLMPFAYSQCSDDGVGNIGGLSFYGTKIFVEQCLKAVNEELPKYDAVLQELLVSGKVKLRFIGFHRFGKSHTPTSKVSSPTTGFYSVPKIFSKEGAEGICPYIVYAYIQTSCTGTGLWAAINLDRNKVRITKPSKQKLIAWMLDKNYPKRWISYFE